MVATRRNKKQGGYQKGDKVEVTRPPSGIAAIGTLVSRQKQQRSSNTPNPTWVIEYENNDKGIISERSIQRLLSEEMEDSPAAAPVTVSDTSCTTTVAKQKKAIVVKRKLKGVTTRMGQPVRKTVLQTGILYVYLETRRAEFVRNK